MTPFTKGQGIRFSTKSIGLGIIRKKGGNLLCVSEIIMYTFAATTYVRYLKVVAKYIPHYNHLTTYIIEDMHSNSTFPEQVQEQERETR